MHIWDSHGSGSRLSVPANSDFGSDQSPIELGLWVWPESQFDTSISTEKLRPQSLKWTGFLTGESPDHIFWEHVWEFMEIIC